MVTAVYVLTCQYNCSHLSLLTLSCPASISPTSLHTETPSVCTQFLCTSHTKEGIKAFFFPSENPAAASCFFCVCLCLSQCCLYCGRIIWLFTGLVLVCYHSAHVPWQMEDYWELLFACVCLRISVHLTLIIHFNHKDVVNIPLKFRYVASFFPLFDNISYILHLLVTALH